MLRTTTSRRVAIATILASLAFAGSAGAQTAPAAPAKPQAATKSAVPPGADYLAKTYGISVAEAARRIGLQPQIAALVQKVNSGNDPDFAGVWIEQTPAFKVVIAYTKPSPDKLAALQVGTNLAPLVELRALSEARSVVLAAQDRVIATLNTAGIKDYVSYIEEETGTLTVKVPTAAVLTTVKTALVPLGITFKTEVGPIPQPLAAPQGVQPGDYIYGGFNFWQTNQTGGATGSAADQYKGCSLSFPVRLGSTQGILTAGHCNPGPTGTGYWIAINGHWVQMPAPTIARWKYGTKYDYQFHETTGFDTGNFVYFENRATEPSYPSSGYFAVTGTNGYYGQTKGMTVCKSGWRTGLVCGTIDNGAYTYNGAKV